MVSDGVRVMHPFGLIGLGVGIGPTKQPAPTKTTQSGYLAVDTLGFLLVVTPTNDRKR